VEKTASLARFIAGLALAVVVAAGLAPDAFVPHAYAQAAGKHASPKARKDAADSEKQAIQRLERAKRRLERARKKAREAEKAFVSNKPGGSLEAELKAWKELASAKEELKEASAATLGGQVAKHDKRLKDAWKSVNKLVFPFWEQMERCSKQGLTNLKGFTKAHISRIAKLRKSLKGLEERLWKWRSGWFRGAGADERRRKEAILTKSDLDLRHPINLILKRARARLDAKGRPDVEKADLSIDEEELEESGFTKAEIERYKRWKGLQLRIEMLDAIAAHRAAELERIVREIEAKTRDCGKEGGKTSGAGKPGIDGQTGKPQGNKGGKNGGLRSFVPHLPATHPAPKPGMTPPVKPRMPAAPPIPPVGSGVPTPPPEPMAPH
jgi:hypothetical protein